MKTLKNLFLPLLFLIIVFACDNENGRDEKNTQDAVKATDSSVQEVEAFIDEAKNYLKNKDIDGDGTSDDILFDYSGGAHCCYKMNIKLSSQKDTISYPFEMEGGYEFGIVDGSNPEQFDIKDYDKDGRPEIFMRINTYNGEEYAIDKEWTEKYGIKTNYIIFDFQDREIVLKEWERESVLD